MAKVVGKTQVSQFKECFLLYNLLILTYIKMNPLFRTNALFLMMSLFDTTLYHHLLYDQGQALLFSEGYLDHLFDHLIHIVIKKCLIGLAFSTVKPLPAMLVSHMVPVHIPANVPEKATRSVQRLGSLPPKWETWMEFHDPEVGLALPQHSLPFKN